MTGRSRLPLLPAVLILAAAADAVIIGVFSGGNGGGGERAVGPQEAATTANEVNRKTDRAAS